MTTLYTNNQIIKERRQIMHALRLLVLASVLATASTGSAATIAVVAPKSGSFTILGQQIRNGAALAAQSGDHTIVDINENCDDANAHDIAQEIINAEVDVAIGFLCSETITASIQDLAQANIPVITLSSRAPITFEDAVKYAWPLFSIAPSQQDEIDASVQAILSHWKGQSIALLDDGTIYSRELVDAIKKRLEEVGLKPSFTDTFRLGQEQQIALIRRLSRVGATHAFIAGDRNDISLIARDAKAEKVNLTIVSGDAIRATNAPTPLQDGVLAITTPEYAKLNELSTIAQSFKDQSVEMEGYVFPSYQAVEIASQIASIQPEQDQTLTAKILESNFQTALGVMKFNTSHQSSQNPFQMMLWNGLSFIPYTSN